MQQAPYDPHPLGFTDFFESLGRPVVFYPSLARMLKSIKAAVFLGQLLYWTPKAHDPDGWVSPRGDGPKLASGSATRNFSLKHSDDNDDAKLDS